MRRVIGSIALGLGVALFVIGLAARPVIYDRLATVPLDQNSVSISEGEGMTALSWSPDETSARYDRLTGVTLRSTRTVKGIPGAVPVDQQDSNAFWQTGVLSEAVGMGDLTSSLEGSPSTGELGRRPTVAATSRPFRQTRRTRSATW